MEIVHTGAHRIHEQRGSFSLGRPLEPREEPPEPTILWMGLQEQLSLGQQGAAWLTIGSFKMNGQHAVWKVSLQLRPAQWPCLMALQRGKNWGINREKEKLVAMAKGLNTWAM